MIDLVIVNRASFALGPTHSNIMIIKFVIYIHVVIKYVIYIHAVIISHSPMKHWYTYNTLRCIGNESNISECRLAGYKEGAGCNSVIVNCQGTRYYLTMQWTVLYICACT